MLSWRTSSRRSKRKDSAHRYRRQGDVESQTRCRAPAVPDTGCVQPTLAHRAIAADPDVDLLLPCNVVVREEADGAIAAAFMDPEAVLQRVDNPEVRALGKEVRTLLQRVHGSLEA